MRLHSDWQAPSSPDPSQLQHYLYASIATYGGVSATYYATANAVTSAAIAAPTNLLASGTAATRRVPRIGTNGAAVTTSNAGATGLWGSTALLGTDSAFVVRWAGMYTNTGSMARYFKWSPISAAYDRVRLWVDNRYPPANASRLGFS